MLRIELQQESTVPIEVFGTSPDALVGLSLPEIRKLRVFEGNRPAEFGSLFSVGGDPGSGEQLWSGPLARVSGIGAGMTRGWIHVEGDCGSFTGAQMGDGTVFVQGSAAHWTGSGMTGGLIQVRGNAGHETGAALAGADSGMNGGTILVEGNAGHATGRLMRRGVIAIRGSAGNCCGYQMRAGTIVVVGGAGKNTGSEMVRGTIVLGVNRGKDLGAGFQLAGIHSMPTARILSRALDRWGFACAWPDDFRFEIRHGDSLHGARGELWIFG